MGRSIFQTKQGLLMFFPRQSRGETQVTVLQPPDQDVFSWRATVSSQALPASVFTGTLARSSCQAWLVGNSRVQAGAPCRQEHVEAGQEAGGGPSEPPAWASQELDPAYACDGLEAQHHTAAGSAGLSFPFRQLGSLAPFPISPGKRKPSQLGARQEAQPALPTTCSLSCRL